MTCVLTLTLSRPVQLSAFHCRDAHELIDANVPAQTMRWASLLSQAPARFCAGMDLSSVGNVFRRDARVHHSTMDLLHHSRSARLP